MSFAESSFVKFGKTSSFEDYYTESNIASSNRTTGSDLALIPAKLYSEITRYLEEDNRISKQLSLYYSYIGYLDNNLNSALSYFGSKDYSAYLAGMLSLYGNNHNAYNESREEMQRINSKYQISEMKDTLRDIKQGNSTNIVRSFPIFSTIPKKDFLTFSPIVDFDLISVSPLLSFFENSELTGKSSQNKRIYSLGLPRKILEQFNGNYLNGIWQRCEARFVFFFL